MFGEALGQLLGGRGRGGGGGSTKGKQRLMDACEKQRTGTFHVELPTDDKNQLKRCMQHARILLLQTHVQCARQGCRQQQALMSNVQSRCKNRVNI